MNLGSNVQKKTTHGEAVMQVVWCPRIPESSPVWAVWTNFEIGPTRVLVYLG
ncbi:hypothetical protein V6Z11_A05G239700 [Gossypium hirsutum]